MEMKRCAFIIALASSLSLSSAGSLDDLIALAQLKVASLENKVSVLEEKHEQHRSLQTGCSFSVSAGTCILTGNLTVPALIVQGSLSASGPSELGSLTSTSDVFSVNTLGLGATTVTTIDAMHETAHSGSHDNHGDANLNVGGALTIQQSSDFDRTIYSNYGGMTYFDRRVQLDSYLYSHGSNDVVLEKSVVITGDGDLYIQGNDADFQKRFICKDEAVIDNDVEFYDDVVITGDFYLGDGDLSDGLDIDASDGEVYSDEDVDADEGDFYVTELFVDACDGCDNFD